MRNGLTDNQINDIARDKYGFLFLATSQGLCKYDGREITVIKHHDYPDFEKYHFSALLKDDHNNIWIGSRQGLFKINSRDELVTIPIENMQVSNVRKIISYKDSVIIHADKTWYICHVKDDSPKVFTRLNSMEGINNLTNVSVFRDQYLVGVSNGKTVKKINLTSGKLLFNTPIEILNTVAFLHDGSIICGAGTGHLFLLNHDGIIINKIEFKKSLHKTTIHKTLNFIREIKPGLIAIATEDDGLILYNLLTGEEKNYTQSPSAKGSLHNNQTVKVFSDEEGNHYVTSLFHGMDFFHLDRYFVKRKESFTDEKHRFFSSYTNSIAQDKAGKLWFGVTDRVIEHDPQKNKSTFHFYHEILGKLSVKVNTLLGFYTLCIDSQGKVWQGSHKGGIVVYNPKTKSSVKLTKFKHQGGISTLPASYIWHIMQDKSGIMWAATNFGFINIHPQTYKVDSLAHHPVLKKLPRKRVKYIFEDSRNHLWFGTFAHGLYCFDKQKNTLSNFNKDNGLANHCYQIKEDHKGRIFVAHENGFSIIHGDHTIEHINIENGLRNRLVEDFLCMDSVVYIANHNTLLQYNADTKEMKYFDEYFDIGDVSFKSNTAIITKDGKMLFGTELGYIEVDPEKLNAGQKSDKLFIHKISDSEGNSYHNERIHLKTDVALTFQFTSVDLFGSKHKYYQYKLDNLHTEWINLYKTNELTFNALPAGKYKLRLRSTSNNTDWAVSDQSPEIIVRRPLYKNPYVYFNLVLMAIGLGGLWFYQQLKSKHKQTKLLQQISEFEVKAIRAQMNPHFIFNALNSIQFFIYNGDVDKANEYLHDFSKLTRTILHQAKNNMISLESEIETLQLYIKLESLRFGSDFIYEIYIEEALKDQIDTLEIPSMMIQPFVENAIKHGLTNKSESKKLTIRFESDKDILVCRVIDNGQGFVTDEIQKEKIKHLTHQSMGIDLVKKRLQYFGAENTVVINTSAGGTEIIIRIPTF